MLYSNQVIFMKKIRFGIVGTGNIAHRFAEAIKNVSDAELTAVASRTTENAEKFGNEFDIQFRFSSYEAMAESDKIDVAYIAVPHSGHKDCSILMMKNGKNVICEKPLAINYKEAKAMFDCAEENNVFLMEAMWARLVPGTIKMLELIKDGVLGEIRGVEGKFCYTFDEDEMDHHALKNENGGGALLDVGIYGLSFASWYLGKDIISTKSVADKYNNTDSHTCTIIEYDNGAIADLSCATLLRKPNEGYIYGTKGFVHLNRFYAPQEIELNLMDGTNKKIEAKYWGNGFEEQIQHVCDCINSNLKESPVITKEQSLFIANQMDEIRKDIGIIYPQDK